MKRTDLILKCVFDSRRPDDPCADCRKRGLACGKALPTQTGGRQSDYSDEPSSPTPSDISIGPISRSVSVEMEPSVAVEGTPASVLLQNATNYASHLEHTYPKSSNHEILSTVRDFLDRGVYGDLRALLYPPTAPNEVHERHSPEVFHPVPLPLGYPSASYIHPTYASPAVPPPHTYGGTINPASLSAPHYTFTDSMTLDDASHGHSDSDSSQPEEFENTAHMVYVSSS